MKNLPKIGAIVFSALAICAVANHFLLVDEPSKAQVTPPRPITHATPPPRETEARETFASSMPTGRGAKIVASNGDFNTSHILVAVPDQFHKIQYLRGSDPRAVKYLAQAKAEHEQTGFDGGPNEADLDAVPLKREALSGKAKRIGFDAGKK